MAAGGIHDQLGGGFHRYATDARVARAALRADALRQRPARARVRPRVGADRRRVAAGDGDRGARLRAARARDRRTAGSRPARTRTPRARRARRSSGRPARCARSWATPPRCSRPRTGSPTPATGRAGRSCRGSGAMPSSRSGSGCRPTRSRPGWPRRVPSCCAGGGARPQPALRRQGARGLERARDRGARRRRPVPRRDRGAGAGRGVGTLRRGGVAGGRGGPRQPPPAGRPAPSLVAGRPGVGRRRARGLREPRGRAAVAVRGDVRRALVRGRRRRSMDVVLGHFADPAGGFFDTPDDGERLVVRPRDVQDNATPSGGAMATTVLLRLAALTGRGPLPGGRRAGARDGRRLPGSLSDRVRAVAVRARAGPRRVDGGRDRRRARRPRHPRRSSTSSTAATSRSGSRPRRRRRTTRTVPLLHGRFALDGRPTAFVCRDFACRLPVTEPEALEALLAGG